MKVWVDCTAAAHPVVLRPIIAGLEGRGHSVEVTTRSYGQTEGLLELLGIPYTSIGEHADSGTAARGAALASRSARLLRWARGRGFDVALAHGSVDIAVVGTLLRIPQVQMQDYEYAGLQRKVSWRAARRVMVPDAIPIDRLIAAGASEKKLVRYPGLKEDYYLADLVPDPGVLTALGLDRLGVGPERERDERVLVVVRPPPESSAYHADNPLYEKLLDRLVADPRAVIVLIPRTEGQRTAAIGRAQPRLIVPEPGDRRAEPDRLLRPRRQRGRHDEPRGGGARGARLHDLQRPDGCGRRGADRGGAAPRAARSAGARADEANIAAGPCKPA